MAPGTGISSARNGRRVALALLFLGGLGGPGAARSDPAGDSILRLQQQFDGAGFCLPVHGAISDASGPLRIAAPPFDPAHGTAFLQGFFNGLVGESATRALASAQGAPRMLGAFMGAPPPLVKLLFDGSRDLVSGRHASAARQFLDCAALAQKQGDELTEAACRNNLGVTRAATGQMAQARSEFEKALSLYGQAQPRPAQQGASAAAATDALQSQSLPFNPATALARIMQSLPADARAQVEATLKKQQAGMLAQRAGVARSIFEFNQRRGSELINLNLGNFALATGRLADAQARMQQAFDGHRAGEPASCRAAAALELARVDQRLDRRAEGQALIAAYPPAPREAGSDEAIGLVELGAVGMAGSSNSTAAAAPRPVTRGEPVAHPGSEDTLKLPFTLDEPADRLADKALRDLLAQALAAQQSNAPAGQVMADWRRLALRAEAGDRPDLGFTAHAASMRLHLARGDAAAAIYDGKQSVNLAQAARANLDDRSPSRDARRAFLRERRQVFVELAQTLLDQERLAEAESVLQILKEDEGQQFIDRPPTAATLPLNAGELARQRHEADTARRLQAAERARVTTAESAAIGGGALRSLSRQQVETLRVRLGLALDSLANHLSTHGFESPGNDAASQALVKETQAFFLGPQPRLEQFMRHLIDDAPRFDPPVDDGSRAKLASILARVPEIRQQLKPLLEAPRPVRHGVQFSFRPHDSSSTPNNGPSALDYLAGEAMEQVWHQLIQADDIEARYLDSPEPALPAAPPMAAGADDSVALMARQTLPTDLLYYLTGEQRLDILLVNASGRRHVRIALTRAELDAEVRSFIDVLKNPDSDPRAAAQAMYRRLFAPIAPAVADSGARVIALSLDGQLRFVPFSALHDGRQWLVENYAIALNPGAGLGGRLKPASAHWRVAGFGATEGAVVGADSFMPLTSVRGELDTVVRREGNDRGALAGNAWLDQDFTAQRLKTALAAAPAVVHIATHFKFVRGDAAASYLLLGDGQTLSLRDLAGPAYRFDRTELVTLSACATGLSAEDGYGQEVDGLAALLMGQGAPSVLASLWEVSDHSTATLMASLYRFHETRRESRVQSLRQAQRSMILSASAGASGDADATGAADRARSVSAISEPGEPVAENPAPRPKGASLGYGHPFYWAPFVLMGDWL